MLLRVLVFGFAFILPAAHAAAPDADGYPQRPVRVLLPFAPGGNSDIVARLIGPKLHELLGQPFVIDNRPGASGNIAVQMVINAQPNGLTLLLGNVATNAINPTTLAGRIGADPGKDLTGVSLLTSTPLILVSGAEFPANTLQEFLAIAKAKPGALNHSASVGNQSHLTFLQLFNAAGVKVLHVPTRAGAGSSITPLLSGEIHVSLINVATVGSLIKQGRLKAYAVSTTRRVPEFPDVPTFAEAGFPGLVAVNWTGVFVPVKTPRPVINKLHAALVAVMGERDVHETLTAQSSVVEVSRTPADFDAYVKSERDRWEKIVRDNNFRIE